MRILITDFFGIMAGSSYSAVYLAEALVQRGHEVWFAYKKGAFIEELLTDRRIKRLEYFGTGKFNLTLAYRIAAEVKRNSIQVVCAQASPDRYLTIFARWFYGMKAVLIHTRRQKPDITGGRLKASFYTKGTDRIVTVSEAVKKLLIDSGIPSRHMTVINNGFPPIKSTRINEGLVLQLSTKYDLQKGDLVIGCVSRIKKQDQILKAVKQMKRPVKLILVGIENNYSHLQSLISELPHHHKVYFTGEVSNEVALNHYPLFTLKVLPSDMEGFSQSILEALAFGVPVIATRALGNCDLIKDGVNGLLFDDGDIDGLRQAISRLIKDKALKEHMLENGVRTAKRYTIDRTAVFYEDLFLRLFSNLPSTV